MISIWLIIEIAQLVHFSHYVIISVKGGETLTCGKYIGTTTIEYIMEIPQKIKNRTTIVLNMLICV